MTIPAGDTTINRYTGNGVADTFDYEFKITAKGDLLVKVFDLNDVEVTLTVDDDYTVSGVGDNDGGSITLTSGALTDGYDITIEDNVQASQLIPFANQSSFAAQSHENAFDKLTRLVKRGLTQLSQTLSFPSNWTGATEMRSLDLGDILQVNEDSGGLYIEGVAPDVLGDAPVYSDFRVDTFIDGVHFTAGTTTQLTLSSSPGVIANTKIFFDGVYQEISNYSLNDDVITFNSAIPLGVNVVEVCYGRSLLVGYFDTSNVSYQPVDPDTATTHTLKEEEVGRVILFDSDSDIVVTLPAQTTEALDVGFFVLIKNEGSGNISLATEGSDDLEGCPLFQRPNDETTVYLKEKDVSSNNHWSTIGNIWYPTAVVSTTLTSPPATPDKGAIYIVNSPATGGWAGQENNFAIHLGSDAYYFQAPDDGQVARDGTSESWIGYNAVDDSWDGFGFTSSNPVTINDSPDSPTAHAVTILDNNSLIVFDTASDVTVTLPEQSTSTLTNGFSVSFINLGGGDIYLAFEGTDTYEGVSMVQNPLEPTEAVLIDAGSPNTWKINNNVWQIDTIVNYSLESPPATPPNGSIYYIDGVGSGGWAGHTREFAIHIGSDNYDFQSPVTRFQVWFNQSNSNIEAIDTNTGTVYSAS